MRRLTLLQENAESIKGIVRNYGAANVRVFGSTAHQTDKKKSDIDLLIDWNQKHSLFDHIELQQTLEDLLNAKIDLVVEESLHWYVRDRISHEAIAL